MTRQPTFLLGLLLLLLIAVCSTDAQTIAAGAKPVTASVVNMVPDLSEWGVGDIQVTFANGQTKLFTKGDKCSHPRVSGKGDVGWSVWTDFDDTRYHHSGEMLKLRLFGGTTKDFQPNSKMITDWNFVDGDSALVIASAGYHGHQYFIKYDIATDRVLGQVDEYKPYAELLKWAQPFSDDKP